MMVLRVHVTTTAGIVYMLDNLKLDDCASEMQCLISKESGNCPCRIDLFVGVDLQFCIHYSMPIMTIIKWMRPGDYNNVVAKWQQEDHNSSLFMNIK